jgi:hypothetical protein
MVARAKVVTAKWGVPSTEPEDLPDFLSNEEIVEKMGGDPRGVFRIWVKKITVVKNKNDDDMLKITAEIFETNKEKKGYNGFAFWENQNVTEQGASFLKQFLKSIGASWADFQSRTKMTAETKTEPKTIISIGKVNFAGKSKVLAKVTVGMDKGGGGYDPKASVRRWLPYTTDDAQEDIEEEELEEDEDLEEEDLEEVEEEDEDLEEEEEGDEEAELREELDGLGIVDLRKRVKTNDADAKTTGLKKAALIDLIVEQELLLDDEEEEEEEEELEEDDGEAEEELRAELGELTLGALKQRAKANGEKVAVLKPIKVKQEVIDIIVDQELNGDDEDGEEPPF